MARFLSWKRLNLLIYLLLYAGKWFSFDLTYCKHLMICSSYKVAAIARITKSVHCNPSRQRLINNSMKNPRPICISISPAPKSSRKAHCNPHLWLILVQTGSHPSILWLVDNSAYCTRVSPTPFSSHVKKSGFWEIFFCGIQNLRL